MRRIDARVLAATAGALLSACSGLYRGSLVPADAYATPDLVHLGDQRVVIVLREPAVPMRLVFAAEALDITYRHVRPLVEQDLASMLRGHVAALDVAFDATPEGYDLYVVPEVKMVGTSSAMGFKKVCASTVTVRVLDGGARVVAERTETGSLEYVMVPSGFDGCRDLVFVGITKAGSAALADADAALGRKGGGT